MLETIFCALANNPWAASLLYVCMRVYVCVIKFIYNNMQLWHTYYEIIKCTSYLLRSFYHNPYVEHICIDNSRQLIITICNQ